MRGFNSFIVFVCLISSCTNSAESSKNLDFEYEYEIREYNRDTTDSNNLYEVEYYDKGKIVRIVREGCTRFLYDTSGRLSERFHGRNCVTGYREIMMYDGNDNLIGKYRTVDTLVNLDTVKYQQIYFYDSSNNLIKELSREWNDSEGKRHEEWSFYSYENGKRTSERIMEDDAGLIWIGTYEYDSRNNLKSIHRVRNKTFWTKTLRYDSANRLIEEEIESNETLVFKNVTYKARNRKTLYQYDSEGHLVVKRTLGHKGNVESKSLYIRRKRS